MEDMKEDISTNQSPIDFTPKTRIMNPYVDLKPKYYPIYSSTNFSVQVIKIVFNNKQILTLKQLKVNSGRKESINKLIEEAKIGRLLGSLTSGTVCTYDVQQIHLETSIIIEMLMSYGGSAVSRVMEESKLCKGEAISIAVQVLNTLTLMEKIGIAHFDIKPQNIVCRKKNGKLEAKIVDFGTSILFPNDPDRVFSELKETKLKGLTQSYAPNEVKDPSRRGQVIPQKADIFSFALTFTELLGSEWQIPTKESVLTQLKKRNAYSNAIEMPGVYKLVSACLSEEAVLRPTFEGLRMDFLKELKKDKEYINVIKQLAGSNKVLCAVLYVEKLGLDGFRISDYEEIYGRSKVKLGNTCRKLAEFYTSLGNYQKAKEYGNKALQLCESINEEGHYYTAQVYNILATIYTNLQEHHKLPYCLRMYKKIIKAIDKKLDADVALFYHNAALYHMREGDFDEAIACCEAVIRAEYRPQGKLHIVTVNAYSDLVQAFLMVGNLRGALEVICEIKELIREDYGGDHDFHAPFDEFLKYLHSKNAASEDHIKRFINLGKQLHESGNNEESIIHLLKTLDLSKEQHNISSKLLGELHHNLGIAYHKLAKFKEAKYHLDNSLAAFSEVQNPDDKKIETINALLLTLHKHDK